MEEKWFEDYAAGDVIRSLAFTLSEAELIDFARTYDPQYLHISKSAAAAGPFGGLIASGWQTCALAFRLFMETRPYGAASLGAPGVDEIKWLQPLRPGDTVRTIVTVRETRPSRSKPDRGLVMLDWEMRKQDDSLIMTMRGPVMLKKRQ